MSAQDVLARLNADTKLSYGHDRPHTLNRYAGGHNRNSQPFISGYWYLYLQPPQALFGDAAAVSEAVKWFHSTAESFTPPSKTVTKVDVPGMGGVASSFAAGQELSRTFTVAFREHQDMPIMKSLNQWTNVIDAKTGMSPLAMHVPWEYKGMCLAALARPGVGVGPGVHKRPSIEQIDQLFLFEGVFPETLPYDTFNADIATNDTVQASVTFSFDGWPLTIENAAAVKQYEALFDSSGFSDEEMNKQHVAAMASPGSAKDAFNVQGSISQK